MPTGNSAATPTNALGNHSQGPPGTPLHPAPDTPGPLSARTPLSHTQDAIDHRFFPHLIDAIMSYAHPEERWRLAQTCRSLRARFGVDLGTHVAVRQVAGQLCRELQMLRNDSWGYRWVGTDPIVFDVYHLGNGMSRPSTSSWTASGSTERGPTRAKSTSSNVSRRLSPLVADVPFTDAAHTWLADANVTIVDLGAVDEDMGITRTHIVRTQLFCRRWRVHADVTVLFLDMAGLRPTAHDLRQVDNTRKLVFVLRYTPTAIPAGPVLYKYEFPYYWGTTAIVVHLVVRQSVQAQEETSEALETLAAKRQNLERFNGLIAFFARSGATVTVVGLERVGYALFGVVPPAGPAESTDWEAFRKRYFTLEPEPRGKIVFLDESEYMRQYDMTPLMLAVERGVGYVGWRERGEEVMGRGRGRRK